MKPFWLVSTTFYSCLVRLGCKFMGQCLACIHAVLWTFVQWVCQVWDREVPRKFISALRFVLSPRIYLLTPLLTFSVTHTYTPPCDNHCTQNLRLHTHTLHPRTLQITNELTPTPKQTFNGRIRWQDQRHTARQRLDRANYDTIGCI